MTGAGYIVFSLLAIVSFGIYRDFRGVTTRMQKWGDDYWRPRRVRYTSVRALRLRAGVFTGVIIALIIFSAATRLARM